MKRYLLYKVINDDPVDTKCELVYVLWVHLIFNCLIFLKVNNQKSDLFNEPA